MIIDFLKKQLKYEHDLHSNNVGTQDRLSGPNPLLNVLKTSQ